jgi:hypothetical protein
MLSLKTNELGTCVKNKKITHQGMNDFFNKIFAGVYTLGDT